jgi:hypothetical protein
MANMEKQKIYTKSQTLTQSVTLSSVSRRIEQELRVTIQPQPRVREIRESI